MILTKASGFGQDKCDAFILWDNKQVEDNQPTANAYKYMLPISFG